ncbi:MAG: patatin-like phospholipase family protein [Leptospiraceae bacterium]|nr:patatin-like phospholipase family protein [Leptospiraceae bacterium]MCP5496273.1 patatin-like phospholipase family protein [Leptospiraceae bacterium]
MRKKKSKIALAIAGGGCKALYGLGVGYKLRTWGIKINEISGVSAGAASALMILSENEEESIEYFEQLLMRNKSNFHTSNLLKGKRPFPHESMYRRTIRHAIDFEKLKKTKVKIYISAIRAFPFKNNWEDYYNQIMLIPQTMQAVILDDKDKEKGIQGNRVRKIVQDWDLKEVIFTNKDIKHAVIAEQLVLISSSIPPIISFQNINGEYYLDGGLVNNLLLEYHDPKAKKIAIYYEETTLFGKKEECMQNTYFIKPQRKIPIHTFDYTNAKGAREAYEMGKEDAEKHKDKLYAFLES